jgi:SPP1 gp7 family putative phage head morphogenesis protein
VAATFGATADVDRYDEAISWFLRRTVITGDAARALDDRLKVEAFWVGAGLQLSQIQRVFDEIAVAQEKGEPFEEWRKRVRQQLRNDVHAETVFRNATQRALNAGRWTQMTDDAALQLRPFWLFDAVLDTRTTDICKDADGTLLPADNAWWLSNWPPRHHRCRSAVRSLRRSEALRRGLTAQPPATEASKGFGHAPGTAPPWKPDRDKHEPELIAELDRKAASGKRKRRARKAAEHKAAHWLPTYQAKYGDAAKPLARGRAAYERGLDMTVDEARRELLKLDTRGVALMREALEDADGALTLREQAGELDPLRKAAAAVAGHLKGLTKRPRVIQADLERLAGGPEGLDFLSAITGPRVRHVGADWTFMRVGRGIGAATEPVKKVVFWEGVSGQLEHELGHTIEILNATLGERSKAFLLARTKGERTRNHGRNGDCWDDQFMSWYTGRRYARPDGSLRGTEIISTGVELVVAGRASIGTLEELARKDLEHLLFVLGQLAGP